MDQTTDSRKGSAPWWYLFGVIAWTWSFLGVASVIGQSLLEFPTIFLVVLGGLGPLIVPGLLVASGHCDSEGDRTVRDFYRRAFDPRTLAWRWYLAIFGLVLVLAVAPVLLDPSVSLEQGLPAQGTGLFLLTGLIFGALEEPGWRGYAQEALQRRMPVVSASLVVGVFWAAWHLPLFLIAGTYQAGLGVNTPEFWAFNLALIAGCPLYAWLYNATGGVAFAAVLFHGLSNVARELVPDAGNALEVGVEAVLAILVTLAAWKWMFRKAANTCEAEAEQG